MSQVKATAGVRFKRSKESQPVHVRTWLLSNGYNHNDISAMMKFAGNKKYATKKQWDEIFSKY